MFLRETRLSKCSHTFLLFTWSTARPARWYWTQASRSKWTVTAFTAGKLQGNLSSVITEARRRDKEVIAAVLDVVYTLKEACLALCSRCSVPSVHFLSISAEGEKIFFFPLMLSYMQPTVNLSFVQESVKKTLSRCVPAPEKCQRITLARTGCPCDLFFNYFSFHSSASPAHEESHS